MGDRPRVVVAGLGDSGVLTALRLARHADVVGISAKPGLVSGQELGIRLSRPQDWARDYWLPFDRLRALDGVRTVHGSLTGVDLDARKVLVSTDDEVTTSEPYDVLVIATGVSNGFWRRPALQTADEVRADLLDRHRRLAAAQSIAVLGGGAAAVSSAANLARVWPDKQISLYFPADRALTGHHPRVWQRISRTLADAGVRLHPGHRAVLPDGFGGDDITDGPVHFSTGQPAATADAVLWAIGRVRPNTDWLPAELLDDDGFVRVTPQLRVPGRRGVFAIGDVAATDPLRSSARNRADGLLARNIRAELAGRPLRAYRPAQRRWGSVLGAQPDGLEVFTPGGRAFRFPGWSIDRVLQPWIVRRGIYRGVRPNDPLGQRRN
ncbi:FAD-dependent oxidoreductase [Mycolicibacterium flavescens]|nr:FAD-dependent oxidoreductase [Mycolicibacterium flavescens]